MNTTTYLNKKKRKKENIEEIDITTWLKKKKFKKENMKK